MRRQALRTLQILPIHFNLNAFSDEESYRMFRFRHLEKSQMMEVCGWKSGNTRFKEYVVVPATTIFVMIWKLPFSTWWKDVETLLSLRHSASSELFCEVMEYVIEKHRNVLKRFRRDLLQSSVGTHEIAIQECDTSPVYCIWLIDCTRIQIARPEGHRTLQQVTYFGHKRIYGLKYQTVTKSDGLMFTCTGRRLREIMK